jgi:hypothetical protein
MAGAFRASGEGKSPLEPVLVALWVLLVLLLGGVRAGLRREAAWAAALLLASPALAFCRPIRRYEFGRFDLVLRAGPFRRRIPLECIVGVVSKPSRGGFGPERGLGPGRVSILYGRGRHHRNAILFPDDPDLFLDALSRHAPFLEKRGTRLVRRVGLFALPR